jgi:hypothetical protein
MPPSPHQDLDGDEDDNIHNPQLNPVTEVNSDNSVAPFFDEGDVSDREDDNSSTHVDKEHLSDKDTPDNNNNSMDADDEHLFDEDMQDKDMPNKQ